MDHKKRNDVHRLSTLIQSEQNLAEFSALLEQLNDLLELKEKRLVEMLRVAASRPQTRGSPC